MLSSIDWHNRFLAQARWTKSLRDYLYQRAGLSEARLVLDVGCGTGALLGELIEQGAIAYGLDISRAHLALAMRSAGKARLACGDAHRLPFPDNSFDIALCHYTLLWVSNPLIVVSEMARITRPGGAVLALAEPDYGGRIDYPDALAQIGAWQREALVMQGADPLFGRKLGGIFHRAGLKNIESGILGSQWKETTSEDIASEWAVIRSDANTLGDVPEAGLSRLYEIDQTAYQQGNRVLFVPTFYAIGFAP